MTKFNLNNLVRANVKAMKPYSSARDEYVSDGSEMVFLDANENPFENGVNRYPDPQQRSLKSIIAAQKGIDESHILLGNGSDEVLDLLFRAFCQPKQDNIITLPPTYGMYTVLSNLNEIEERKVVLQADFQPDVDAILKAVDAHSKLLFICSPNNPTGNLIAIKKVKQLLETFQGIVVIDEAYIDFADQSTWVNELSNYPNLIVTQTLSKAYGLAGIRLGVCFAAAEVIAVLNKIKPPYNVNELTQKAAMERLMDEKGVENEIKAILEERSGLIAALQNVDFVKTIYPTEANFVLAKVDDATKRYNELLAKGIVIRNRTTQALCENTLRFTVGTPEENKLLIAALKSL
ncbi:histidinol-phosphate transaminase [Aquimarina agarilytica]|uniref:histidinol-phosphate transaminase n=1 Tax=Aquimarina agarilytica TaxID=1087449 RepID=UPI000289AD68|nr:histidinol-phosphate transaminase [Aquimarina agarilytica]